MFPEINFLRTKTGISPEVALLTFHLKRIGFALLAGVLAAGVIVAGAYFYLQSSLTSLTDEKRLLIAGISGVARKEALYRLLKEETGVAGKVMKNQKQWNNSLEMIDRIVSFPLGLSAISLNDKQELLLSIKSASIENASGVIAAVVSEAAENHLKNPTLRSFELNADGTIRMSISFISLL